MSYAKRTTVDVSKSQEAIKRILTNYKATSFAFGKSDSSAVVLFEIMARRIKFVLPLPKRADYRNQNVWEQLCRSRWRCLLLAIKTKLECVETGITTLEQEFLAHIVLPSGQTVGAVMIPQIAASYGSGKMPPLLGFGGSQ